MSPVAPLPVPSPALLADLVSACGAERVHADALHRVTRASDASFYRKIPLVVVEPRTEAQVVAILAASRAHRVPVTFRAAGTSLSGQAVTDGILVWLAGGWSRLVASDDGAVVTCGPAVRGGTVNRFLAPHSRRIGPDPASIDTAMIGGIVANNASGMCCGVAESCYHTLQSLRFVLPDGQTVDGADADADERLAVANPALVSGLLAIRDEVRADEALVQRIRNAYRIKNTTGYGLNALLDHDTPVAILTRLLVGSEGTLAFLSEVRLRTLPTEPHQATALLLYPDVHAAVAAVAGWSERGARAIELLDAVSLQTMGRQPDVAEGKPAALLVELRARSTGDLATLLRDAEAALDHERLLAPAAFTTDPDERAALWRLRKGLFPAVGARKATGHTVIIEDVSFPPSRLAKGVVALRELLDRSGYADAVIFGHARDGNVHFVFDQTFGDEASVTRYARFLDELAPLVLSRGGSLKAEHGTGRNMAPFVERQWGADATAIMWRLKHLVDPDGLLNPGVVLNHDPTAHVRDLKILPTVDPEVDRCIECGFCEPVCPSRNLTLTPRQRIALRREEARGGLVADSASTYALLDTCAADGLCGTTCPVHIDTGSLVKRLRADRAPAAPVANAVQRRFAAVEWVTAAALRAAHLLDSLGAGGALAGLADVARRWLGVRLPRWTRWMGHPNPVTVDGRGTPTEVVLFPTCVSRLVGTPVGVAHSPTDALRNVAEVAGCALVVPGDPRGMCCGLAFASKGYPDAARAAAVGLIDTLWAWSDGGRLPVVVDASSCVHALLAGADKLPPDARERLRRLDLTDAVGLLDRLRPRLRLHAVRDRVVLHPTCATQQLGGVEAMRRVAAACAGEVIVPASLGCCGMAGDRGLLYPELPASALTGEAAEVRASGCASGFGSSPFCEIGLSEATGVPYRALVYLVEEALA